MEGTILIVVLLLFVLNLGLMAIAVTDLMRRKNVKYMPKIGWIIIIALTFVFGSALYLLAGRGAESAG